MKIRKRWTIINTHEVTVRRSLSAYVAYCRRCQSLNRTVALSEAVTLRGGNPEMFNDLLEADEVHFAGDRFGGLICLESLLSAPMIVTEIQMSKQN